VHLVLSLCKAKSVLASTHVGSSSSSSSSMRQFRHGLWAAVHQADEPRQHCSLPCAWLFLQHNMWFHFGHPVPLPVLGPLTSSSLCPRLCCCCCVLCVQGENTWVFVHEDDIADAVKHWHSFSDDLFKEAKAMAPKGVEAVAPTSLSCVIMDNKALSPAEVREKWTRSDTVAQIVCCGDSSSCWGGQHCKGAGVGSAQPCRACVAWAMLQAAEVEDPSNTVHYRNHTVAQAVCIGVRYQQQNSLWSMWQHTGACGDMEGGVQLARVCGVLGVDRT
jgi:hypothetical protein